MGAYGARDHLHQVPQLVLVRLVDCAVVLGKRIVQQSRRAVKQCTAQKHTRTRTKIELGRGSEPNIFDLFAIPPNFAPAPGHARLVHLAEARGKALGLEPACLSLKAGAYDWAG